MKQVLVSESSGRLLDWLVAKCDDFEYEVYDYVSRQWACREGVPKKWAPSTDWAQGGEIIEVAGIGVSVKLRNDRSYPRSGWMASLLTPGVSGSPGFLQSSSGPTPLVAAMRCYVQARFGKVVEVSDEIFASLTDSANKE